MAKFKLQNLELKDSQKLIFDSAKAKYITYDGSETLINTTLSGVTPTGDGHLTTKAYVDSEITTATGSLTTDHGSLTGLGDDDHALYLLASDATDRSTFATNWTDLTDAGDTTLHGHDHDQLTNYVAGEHFLEANIDHTSIQNIGTNTHAQIDTKIDRLPTPAAENDGQALTYDNVSGNYVHSTVSGSGSAGTLDLGAILTVNGEYKGTIIQADVDETPEVGDLMYQKANFKFGLGTAASGVENPVYGMATTTSTGVQDVMLNGQLCNTSWDWDAGMLWLSSAAGGAMTQTVVSGVGQNVQPVGFALSADTVYFTGYAGHGRL